MLELLHSASVVLADWFLETSVQVAVLVAVVWTVCAVAGERLTARWRYALWALVFVRLLLPVVPSSPVSLHNVGGAVASVDSVTDRSEGAASSASPNTARDRTGPADPDDRSTSPTAEIAPAEPADDEHGAASSAPTGHGSIFAAIDRDGPDIEATESRSTTASAMSTAWPWRSSALLLWLTGAALALGWTLFRELRFVRRLRAARIVDEPRVEATLAALLTQAGVTRRVRVVRTDLVDGPALTGVLRPRILIPGRVLDGLSDVELRHVLAHEVEHLRAGDVLQNWVMAALTALHWFNPLVRLAVARLRVEREALRDLAALRGEPQEARQAYGRTLLRLLESGARPSARPMAVSLLERRRDLRRRIEMIARDGSGGRRAWLVGGVVTLAVMAVGMTGATSGPAAAQDDDAGADVDRSRGSGDGRGSLPPPADGTRIVNMNRMDKAVLGAFVATETGRIHVERRTPPPVWDAPLRAKLDLRVDLTGGRMTATAFLAEWSEAAGIEVVVHEQSRKGVTDAHVVVPGGVASARSLLETCLEQLDLAYSQVEGNVVVGVSHQIPIDADQRFYRIEPIVEQALAQMPRNADDFAVEDWDDDVLSGLRSEFRASVMDLIHVFVPDGSWEGEGASMVEWRGLLLINQSERVHARIEAFLNMLLRREIASDAAPAWRAESDKALSRIVSFQFGGAALGDVAAYLSKTTGITVIVPLDAAEEVPINLKLADVPVLVALQTIARMSRLHLIVREGAVILRSAPPMVVRPYEIRGGLVEVDSQGQEHPDPLINLVQYSAAPRSWEEFESAAIVPFDGMLIVRNTEAAHAKIAEFLAAARRALAK